MDYIILFGLLAILLAIGVPVAFSLLAATLWWLEDEWRAANPPYTLGVIMQRWLQAFTNHTDETRGEYKTDSD